MKEDNSRGFGLDELARQLSEAVPENLKALRDDLQRNFKVLLQAGLARMDLVTREEFEVQKTVLERARTKLETLEARLRELEQALKAEND